jgi:hypothetical protein
MIVFSAILFISLDENCVAEESPFYISIKGEPTYKLTNTIERNGRVIGKSYKIDIIFTNSGNYKSDEIEVNLTDQEGYTLIQRTYFNAGETKTITFNWSTVNIINQKLQVNYYPSNLDTAWNNYNSGKKSFTVKVVDSSIPGASTPGFEIILLIATILCITFLIKRKY